eukprot:6206390-Pleurochrysis_carterae.AAC.1
MRALVACVHTCTRACGGVVVVVRTEAVNGRQSGEDGVGDALRDEHDADGDAAHQVVAQRRARVAAQPRERGHAPPQRLVH